MKALLLVSRADELMVPSHAIHMRTLGNDEKALFARVFSNAPGHLGEAPPLLEGAQPLMITCSSLPDLLSSYLCTLLRRQRRGGGPVRYPLRGGAGGVCCGGAGAGADAARARVLPCCRSLTTAALTELSLSKGGCPSMTRADWGGRVFAGAAWAAVPLECVGSVGVCHGCQGFLLLTACPRRR